MVRTINQALIGHKISEQEFIRVKDRFGEPELKWEKCITLIIKNIKNKTNGGIVLIKLNQASVSKEISSIRTNGQGLKQSNGNVNLSKTNLVTFKEYVNMFEDYQSALSNYENIIEQDTTAMDTTVTEIVENDREIAGQINK